MISNKQNVENEDFKVGFPLLKIKNRNIQAENQTFSDKNLKIDSLQDLENGFGFQTPSKV